MALNVTAEFLPKYPANLVAGSGTTVDKSGGSVSVGVNFATVSEAQDGFVTGKSMSPATTKSALAYPQVRTPIWMPGRDYALPIGGGTGTAAIINAALATIAATGGGKLILPPETISLDATIDNKYAMVTVEGMAYTARSDVNTTQFSTLIAPTFAGVALKHRTPYDGPSRRRNNGGGFVGISVVGNNVATRLLEVDSVVGGAYDMYLTGCTTPGGEAALFTSGVTGTDIGDAADVQRAKINLRVVQSSDTGPNAGSCNCIRFDGSSNANFSFNTDINLYVRHQDGDGIVFAHSDNNYINTLTCQKVGGVGRAFVSKAFNTGNARQNVINLYSANSVAYVEGTEAGTYPSNIRINIIDVDNSAPMPTFGPGASVVVLNAGNQYVPTVSAASGTITSATAEARWFSSERLVTVCANVSIITNGTGSGLIRVTLPIPVKSTGLFVPGIVMGTEVVSTGKAVVGTVEGSYASFSFYDGTYPGADGRVFRVQFTYERD